MQHIHHVGVVHAEAHWSTGPMCKHEARKVLRLRPLQTTAGTGSQGAWRLTPAHVMPYTPSMYSSWHAVKATITPKPTELAYGACAVGFILRSITHEIKLISVKHPSCDSEASCPALHCGYTKAGNGSHHPFAPLESALSGSSGESRTNREATPVTTASLGRAQPTPGTDAGIREQQQEAVPELRPRERLQGHVRKVAPEHGGRDPLDGRRDPKTRSHQE